MSAYFLTQPSGTHAINPKRAKEWIDAQATKIRQQAASDLITCTRYITTEELCHAVRRLVYRIYTEMDITTDVVVYAGERSKSGWVVTELAIYYIREFGFREPKMVIEQFEDCESVAQGGNTVLIFDDVAYSGTQLGGQLEEIQRDCGKTRLIVALAFANRIAMDSLVEDGWPTLLVDTVLPTIVEQVGPKRAIAMLYFFSPYLIGQPYVSVYTDWKIADEPSTFQKVLKYGPVLPLRYGWPIDEDIACEWLYGYYRSGLFVTKMNVKTLPDVLFNLVAKQDGNFGHVDGTVTRFVPFINGCSHIPPPMSYKAFIFSEASPAYPPDDVPEDQLEISKQLAKQACWEPFYKVPRNVGGRQRRHQTKHRKTRRKSRKNARD